ncbi:MAG: RraA family protein [Ginsengibacter sp.]|jgi:regulator of RNase E activity RraA
MKIWKNDNELFVLAKQELFTALVGDVLDKLGFLHQFLPQQLKPLDPKMVVIGRAMPVLEADVFDEVAENSNNPIMQKPFGLMFEALDSLKENEVYICTGSSPKYALWGGLMSVRAIKLKAAGAVMNGFSRDTNQILHLNFPTFSLGTYAQDQGPRGKVIDYRIPIEWGHIRISPGDIIFGDRDGVLVIPKEAEEEAFVGALKKAHDEKLVLKDLQSDGMSSVDVFQKFGIM